VSKSIAILLIRKTKAALIYHASHDTQPRKELGTGQCKMWGGCMQFTDTQMHWKQFSINQNGEQKMTI